MIRRITQLVRSRFQTGIGALATAAGALVLAGCAGLPAEQTDAQADSAPASNMTPNAATTRAPGGTSYSDTQPAPPSNNDAAPSRTVTLPPKGRVSLAEYRTQMREQLMRSENARAEVADCAAHASWVVPRSATYDALRIPTGALGDGQATVERWEGRFSPVKQAVPVTAVVTFAATAHRRNGESRWDPVKVRCGYDDGMMLAYELLDDDGTVITEPAAKPAVEPPVRRATAKKSRSGKSSAKATRTRSSKSSAKARSSGSSKAKSSKSSASTKSKTSKSR